MNNTVSINRMSLEQLEQASSQLQQSIVLHQMNLQTATNQLFQVLATIEQRKKEVPAPISQSLNETHSVASNPTT